jgi:integrase
MITVTTYNDMVAMIQADQILADSSKAKYIAAALRLAEANVNPMDRDSLKTYAGSLSNTARSHLKAVITKWTAEKTLAIKANSLPETDARDSAALRRLEAIADTIKITASKGEKSHIWLSQREVKRLKSMYGTDARGQRDSVIIGLLVSAGLRCDELRRLTFADIKQKPVRGKIRTVVHIVGKGAKERDIPISDSLAALLDRWAAIAAGGSVALSIDKGGNVGDSLSNVGIFGVVREAGSRIDKPELTPHDLRRTYAQIGYEAGVPITQISKLLGHSTIAVTQRYLNLDLDLETTISDFVPY